MTSDGQLLAELATVLDLDPDEDDIASEAFEHLTFTHRGDSYASDLVRTLVIELERCREAGLAMREFDREWLGLLYYEPGAADGDEETRVLASERFVREVAGGISDSFVAPP